MTDKKLVCRLLVLLLILTGGCRTTGKFATVPVKMPELENLEEGTYVGHFTGELVSASVKIFVEDNQMKQVELLKHDHLLGKKAEVLVKQMMEKQTIELDAVSGATVSSNAILQAAENAFRIQSVKEVENK